MQVSVHSCPTFARPEYVPVLSYAKANCLEEIFRPTYRTHDKKRIEKNCSKKMSMLKGKKYIILYIEVLAKQNSSNKTDPC